MQDENSTLKSKNIPQIQSVKKFYFLDYIYILLDSIKRHSKFEDIFVSFVELKTRYRLGESKYKKLTADIEEITDGQIRRFLYTFKQVLEESTGYDLVDCSNLKDIRLTQTGKALLRLYNNQGALAFNEHLLKFMEKQYGAFRYINKKLYSANKNFPGLLFLPSYSPRQLGIERKDIKSSSDFIRYTLLLVDKLENDIEEIIGERRNLKSENDKIIKRLISTGLLSSDYSTYFNPEKYNVITKRIRDAWMAYFLLKIYHYKYSMASFDIWTYRGKQIGTLHATEFHPYFQGKIVYPLSVVMKSVSSPDFSEIFKYDDGNILFLHKPEWSPNNQERFVDSIVKAYFDLRKTYRSYFVNLIALREIVCFSMKISEKTFEEFINLTYALNLNGKLPIRISFEVDKLPEETTAMYLKREPVMIDKKYRNIIAIDATKGGK